MTGWFTRRKWRDGAELKKLIARDVKREIRVIDASDIADGFVVASVRTRNLLYEAKGLKPVAEFGAPVRIEVAKAWDWHGQSWGGNPDDPEGRSIADSEV